jgi:imidazolonepropionase
MKTILFTNIRQLVLATNAPMEQLAGREMSNLPTLSDAYLLVRDGRIADFGAMSACPTFAVSERVDATDCFVLPAWCDSHTHLVFAATREAEFVDKIRGASYAEIAAKGGGIINSALRLRGIDENQLFDQALARLHKAMQQGTGAIEIKSGYGLDMASELKMLRVIRRLKAENLIPIKATFLAAHAVPPEYKDNKSGYLQHVIQDILPRVADENLADYCDIFCEKGFFTVEDTDLLLTAAAKYGLPAKIHANQLDFSGGVQIGVQHRARSVDHLEHAGEAEIQALLGSDTMPTLLPSAAFFLRLPFPPARKMIDSGLPVAIATDFNPGSAPASRMAFAVSLACIQMRMLPEEAIAAATINGAKAMDLQAEVGSIAIGKRANLLLTQKMQNLAFVPYNFGADSHQRVLLGNDWY